MYVSDFCRTQSRCTIILFSWTSPASLCNLNVLRHYFFFKLPSQPSLNVVIICLLSKNACLESWTAEMLLLWLASPGYNLYCYICCKPSHITLALAKHVLHIFISTKHFPFHPYTRSRRQFLISAASEHDRLCGQRADVVLSFYAFGRWPIWTGLTVPLKLILPFENNVH